MLHQFDFRDGRRTSDSSAGHVTKRGAELVQDKFSAVRCPPAFLSDGHKSENFRCGHRMRTPGLPQLKGRVLDIELEKPQAWWAIVSEYSGREFGHQHHP